MAQSNDEEWRPVVGYEGRYEVSNIGRVRSLISGQVLKPRYGVRTAIVTLYRSEGGVKLVDAGDLMKQAFNDTKESTNG